MTPSSAVAVRKFIRALMEECILYKRWIDQHDMSMGQRKNLSPWQNQTYDLPNTARALYPLSYENSWRARSLNWVHMWQVYWILQWSALLKSSLPGVQGVMCLIPFWVLDFSLSHACVMLINLAHSSLPSLKFVNHLYSLINVNFLWRPFPGSCTTLFTPYSIIWNV